MELVDKEDGAEGLTRAVGIGDSGVEVREGSGDSREGKEAVVKGGGEGAG